MSQQGICPPKTFDFSKPEEWQKWLQRFERYRIVSGLDKKDTEIQLNHFVYCLGEDAEDILRSFTLTDEDKKKYDKVKDAFEAFFKVRKNVIYERARFNLRNQGDGESIDVYIAALYSLADNCEFGILKGQLIRDRIVVGIRDKGLSESMQLKADLTLASATTLARQSESVRSQQAVIQGKQVTAQDESIDAMTSRPWNGNHRGPRCPNCARVHGPRCPAANAECFRCFKKGHFQHCCKAPRRENVQETTEEDQETLFVGHLMESNTEELPWYVHLSVSNVPVKFKIDTGADVSIMSESVYRRVGTMNRLKPCTSRLMSPGGKVVAIGQFIARIRNENAMQNIRIVVVPDDYARNSLLSRDASVRLGLIKRLDMVITDDVFGECGKVECTPVKIVLTDDAEPYCVSTPRREPIPRLPLIEAELKRLVNLGVIEPITEPTDWCAPMVTVPKKTGAVRITVDLTKLNRAVKRERYLIPTLDDILHKLKDAKVFSSLDASSGFHQIPLDSESSKLTTFISPFGRFSYKRLCMGITSAPEIFQREMTKILGGITDPSNPGSERSGVVVLMDDILIFGDCRESHDRVLAGVFSRIRACGLKLNKAKCKFRQASLRYFGHVISEKGLLPDPERVEAIRNIPPPGNLNQLRSFIGMVNYLGRFLPNLAHAIHPLVELLKESSGWVWDHQQQRAYEDVIGMLSSTPTLAYYNVDLPTVITADSSSYGIGGAILQMHGSVLRPVAYCSRVLSQAERRYAQIEKELLASTWVCERFSRYLIGLERFELQTDHKPLIPLINKTDIDRAPIRCQRLLLRMMRFSPEAKFVPGKQLTLADALSRHPLDQDRIDETSEDDIDALVEQAVVACSDELAISPDVIRRESLADKGITEAVQFTQSGWPKYASEVEEHLKPYFAVKSSLSLDDGVLLYSNRIVVPAVLRPSVLKNIHEGHQGIHKSTERAKLFVWWPRMAEEIKSIVGACSFCEEHRNANKHEPLIPSPLPERPWQEVAADFCDFQNKKYLVVVDKFSRWIEIIYVPRADAECTVNKFKSLFSRWGSFETLYSDNGQPFASTVFANFLRENGVTHKTSSPRFPQSNGAAERAVAVAKRILAQPNSDAALFAYRSTPHTATGSSPAKLFIGRELRSKIPAHDTVLFPEWPNFHTVQEKDAHYKANTKFYYNRRHGANTSLSQLQPGDDVRVRVPGEKTWTTTGRILSQHDTPRSYMVQTNDGIYRRNRLHLMSSQAGPERDDIPAAHENAIAPASPPPIDGGNRMEPRRSIRERRQVNTYQAGFS